MVRHASRTVACAMPLLRNHDRLHEGMLRGAPQSEADA